MKKIIVVSVSSLVILTSCGRALEDRQEMHSRAKVFQDSIATMIRTSMAEAEAPANGVPVPAQTPTPVPVPAQPAK